MTPDGDTLVIGRAAYLGSETDPYPDAVFVLTRDAGVWSDPVEITPVPAPDPLDQFGRSVTINAAGDTIAVGAPGCLLTNWSPSWYAFVEKRCVEWGYRPVSAVTGAPGVLVWGCVRYATGNDKPTHPDLDLSDDPFPRPRPPRN